MIPGASRISDLASLPMVFELCLRFFPEQDGKKEEERSYGTGVR